MPSVQFVFVLLSLAFSVGRGMEECPDDIDKMLTKYDDLNQLARYCGAKHQFHCNELDGLLCTILNLDFDCDGQAFCPNPLQAISRLMQRFREKKFGFNNVIIEANMNNGRNGSLTLPPAFLDELDLMESESLTLTNLNLTDLPSIKNRKSLKKITIWGNLIEVLNEHTFYELTSLTSLDLQFNKIKQLTERAFAGLDSLEELNLSNNLLAMIKQRAFYKVPGLRTLTISNNQLHFIDPSVFLEIRSLTHLDLSSNDFEELPQLQDLENLEFLAMNENRLKKVRIERLNSSSNDVLSAGYPFEKLEIIEFNRNNITEFYCDPRLPSLYNILLNRNLLTSLDKDSLFDYLNLSKMLAIKGNPLDCQKIKWMTELKSNFLSISKATCQFDNSLHELGALKELVALMPDQPAASTVHQVGRLFASTNTKNTKNDTSTNDSSSSVLVCPNWSLLTLTWILNLIWLL